MVFDNKTISVFAAAAFLRLLVFLVFPGISDLLTSQVEISTPISSYKRLQEGLFLYQRGVSPYDGGIYHQAPLLLILFELLPSAILFTGTEILNAASLKAIADNLQLSSPRFKPLDGFTIATAYLFNPLTILSCLGRSMNLFGNAAIIQAVLNAQSGNPRRAMYALAVGTYLSMYPALLLPPVLLMMYQDKSANKLKRSSVSLNIFEFVSSLALLLGGYKVVVDSFWEFVTACYGVQITVPDLTPNVGLWWYFFIEIFDSFREFFIGVFWLHLFGYVGGLTYRLQKEPLFVITTLLGLFAVFKPYPSIADVSLYLAFLPMYQHILPLTRYTFIAASVLLYSTLLGPAFYYLWIYAGSGNANFFYAITLVWSLGLTILIGDTLFAVLRDEWEIERPEMKGKDVRRI